MSVFEAGAATIPISIDGMNKVLANLNTIRGELESKLGGSLMKGLAILGVGGGIAATLGVAIHKAIDAQESQEKLRAALDASGQSASEGVAKFSALATAINNTTAISKGEVKGLLESATNMGLNIDAAQEYTKAAIGLARITGGSATEAMNALVKAGHGNTTALQRLSPALAGITGQHALMAKAMELATKGMEEQEAHGNSLSGKWDKLHQSVGALLTRLGQVFLPIVEAIVDALQTLITTLFGSSQATQDFGDKATGNIAAVGDATQTMGGVVQTVAGWIKNAATEICFQWKEIGNTAAIAWVGLEAGLSGVWDALVNTFKNGIEVVKWFFENWKSIFSDIFNYGVTIFKNLADNIINAVSRAWHWITGSKEPEKAFKNLADGFVATTKAMPQLKFESSATTKALQDELTGLMTQRMKDADAFQQQQLAHQQQLAVKQKQDAHEVENIHLDALGGKETKSKSNSGFEGLVDFWKKAQESILKADQRDALAAAKKTAHHTERIAKTLEKIEKKPNYAMAG